MVLTRVHITFIDLAPELMPEIVIKLFRHGSHTVKSLLMVLILNVSMIPIDSSELL